MCLCTNTFYLLFKLCIYSTCVSLVTWYETITRFRIIFTVKFPFIRALRNKKDFFFLHRCFVYGRFLNLRRAGWGVPLVPFGWVHPEVTQTPGGPLRPGWPLNPGLPTWPLLPGFPGWPSKALPGRPGRPVVETWNVFLITKLQGKLYFCHPLTIWSWVSRVTRKAITLGAFITLLSWLTCKSNTQKSTY